MLNSAQFAVHFCWIELGRMVDGQIPRKLRAEHMVYSIGDVREVLRSDIVKRAEEMAAGDTADFCASPNATVEFGTRCARVVIHRIS